MGRWDRTHEALRRAAFALFAEQGYDAAGTAQIASRAGVSEMTLFRHFPSKESLLLEDPFDPLIAGAVRSRPSDEPAMRALAEGIRQAWVEVDPDGIQALHDRLRIVASTASLRGAIERNSETTVAMLVDALIERGVGATEARIAAAAVISGLSVALLEWARSEQTAPDETLGAALDGALDVLAGA